jgi:hypothetical protein
VRAWRSDSEQQTDCTLNSSVLMLLSVACRRTPSVFKCICRVCSVYVPCVSVCRCVVWLGRYVLSALLLLGSLLPPLLQAALAAVRGVGAADGGEHRGNDIDAGINCGIAGMRQSSSSFF